MELKEFIKATITDIVDAVDELKVELNEKGAVVDPFGSYNLSQTRLIYKKDGYSYPAQDIEFSLSLSVSKESKKGGKITLNVIGAGMGKTTGTENQTHVKFSIPIVYSTSQQ